MNHQDVIDWQLAQLQEGQINPDTLTQQMPEEMQAYVAQHPELAAELETLQLFWGSDNPLPMPSHKVKQGFYAALECMDEPSIAPHSGSSEQTDMTPSNITQFVSNREKATSQHHTSSQPWLQAAVIALVFVLGMFTGQGGFKQQGFQQQQTAENGSIHAIASLQQQVADLSSLMAISMLQENNSSQRLAGVSYSRQANLGDPALLDSLLTALSEESSTAVKLAIIDTLQTKTQFTQVENELLLLTLAEPQPLVQVSLSRLLLTRGSNQVRQQLLTQMAQQSLDPDVAEFLELMTAQTRV